MFCLAVTTPAESMARFPAEYEPEHPEALISQAVMVPQVAVYKGVKKSANPADFETRVAELT